MHSFLPRWMFGASTVLLLLAYGFSVQGFNKSEHKALTETQAMSYLSNSQVSCGVTATQIQPAMASSMCFQNTSATCVNIGGSAVTSSTGISIGDGCAGGKLFCSDVKLAWCVSSAPVTIDIVSGAQ